MALLSSSYRSLPSKPGIYLFLDKKGGVLYVGKAKNLKKRVSSYFVNAANLLEKTKILVSQIKKIKYVIAESEIEALLLEANHIKKYMPKYNARLRDGKRYPLIRITVKDKYPKVLIARRYEEDSSDKGSMYFGPFPNSGAVHLVLKTIRRIFPFQSVVNHPKRICLYNHLGLCPCLGVSLSKDTPYVRSILAKEYRKSINHIIDFLKGHTQRVLRDLEKERNALSKQEAFEKAQTLQKKIDAILYVTSPFYQKFDHRINPNLDADLRNRELLSLKESLAKHNLQVKRLERIECFDISNISGTNATGSMVVFLNGEKDSSQYRKFRIRNLPNFPDLPNDFAMMQQVISRRLNHKEWPIPDLIIVDGGKGQVSAAMNAIKTMEQPASPAGALNNETMEIPIIGLAKREETIIIPLNPDRHSGPLRPRSEASLSRISLHHDASGGDSGVAASNAAPQNDDRGTFKEISLPENSPALHLLMRIRDEAHRFAISYHRKLRSKQLIFS